MLMKTCLRKFDVANGDARKELDENPLEEEIVPNYDLCLGIIESFTSDKTSTLRMVIDAHCGDLLTFSKDL